MQFEQISPLLFQSIAVVVFSLKGRNEKTPKLNEQDTFR